MIVDDTHVCTAHPLRDFLTTEHEWEIASEWYGRSVALRKLAGTDGDELWLDQPCVAARRSVTHQRGPTATDIVRAGEWDVLRGKSASALFPRVRDRLAP